MEPTSPQFNKKPFPQTYLYPHQVDKFNRQTSEHKEKVESSKPMRPITDKSGGTSWVQD
jgi:hypothetical protein